MNPLARFIRQRLHRRIFAWFGASILITALLTALVSALHAQGRWGAGHYLPRAQAFVSGQFAQVWDDAPRRDALARAISEQLGLDVVLEDTSGTTLASFGRACKRGDLRAPVHSGTEIVGEVRLCAGRHFQARGSFFVPLLVGALTLWAASGVIARRLTRPLTELVRVTSEIGAGNLQSRVTLRRSRYGEVAVLADAINDMAGRIQKQLADQRELLAAVSHEIRSPLSRMRVLVELARDSADHDTTLERLAGIERELGEINELTGKLLASSRLDFAALEQRELDAPSFVAGVLERAGADPALLDCPSGLRLRGDPTLLSRALSNLLENAEQYASGAVAVRVAQRGDQIELTVRDRGPGFDAPALSTAFESFVRGQSSAAGTSLGLGLALVRRIALAHGGRAWARNLAQAEGPGAEVGFSVRAAQPELAPDGPVL